MIGIETNFMRLKAVVVWMSGDYVVLGSIIAIFLDDIFHGAFHNTKSLLSDLRSCIDEKNNGNIYDERTQHLIVVLKLKYYRT